MTAAAACFPGLVGSSGRSRSSGRAPSWFRDAWEGSLDRVARTIYAGARTEKPFAAGWPAVWSLSAATPALAVIAIRTRRYVGAPIAVAVLALCLVPVVAGATALTAMIIAISMVCTLLLAAALLDRVGQRSRYPCSRAFAAPPAAGYAAMTRDASVAVLAVTALAAVIATVFAASDLVRAVIAATAAVLVSALAGVWTAASGTQAAAAGFAAALTAGVIVACGAHIRARVAAGIAVEISGCAAFVVGLAIAAQSVPWLAGLLTAVVPLLLVAALAPERAKAYGSLAAVAALGASWAWLGAAHVVVVEAYTVPAAVVALGAGLLARRAAPRSCSLFRSCARWVGIGLDTCAQTNDDIAHCQKCAVIAFVVVVFGAWKRLQAPLVLGALVLLVLAIDTFGPAAARLPEWVPLATIGVLLMWIGATFERRREGARRATDRLLQFG